MMANGLDHFDRYEFVILPSQIAVILFQYSHAIAEVVPLNQFDRMIVLFLRYRCRRHLASIILCGVNCNPPSLCQSQVRCRLV